MWSDNESAVDLLGCTHLVAAVLSIVENEDLLPATIGIYGDWGSGKTTVLRIVEDQLKGTPGVLLVSFNGWQFEGYEDAKTAIIAAILDEIGSKQNLSATAKSWLSKLWKRVNVMRILGWAGKGAAAYALGGKDALAAAAVGEAASVALGRVKDVDLDEAGKLLAEASPDDARRGIREFRTDFARLVKEANVEKVVVTIDDLDRCLPETIIQTLEAIKLFLFVPGTAFIIGADERLVKYAVRQRFPELPGERVEVGRDYLEKLVQFPVRVPPLGRAEMETYINLLFAKNSGLVPGQFEALRAKATEACAADTILDVRVNHRVAKTVLNSIPDVLADGFALSEQITPLLSTGTSGNPRQCKRFLNMLVMRQRMAKARGIELKSRVLAKLMLLEYFRPESFKKLAEAQSQHSGALDELRLAEETSASPTQPAAVKPAPSASNSQPIDGKPMPPRPGSPSKKEADEVAVPELPSWLADPWAEQWLRMEPALAAEDLRPYLYFSRDMLSTLGASVQRLSPAAQQALTNLLQKSEAVRKLALQKAKDASPVDAAAVFEALAQRARQEDDLGASDAAFGRLCEWTAARSELFSQLVIFLEGLPQQRLPVPTVTRMEALINGDPERKRQVKAIFTTWAAGSGNLASAAKSRLTKL